jgi:hypothetical protein
VDIICDQIPAIHSNAPGRVRTGWMRVRLRGMSTWRDDRVREIRARLQPGDEGSLWMLLFDDPLGEPLAGTAISEAMENLDQAGTEHLASLLRRFEVRAALLAIVRRDGAPRPEDRRLWDGLDELLDGEPELIDLLVVGSRRTWSARDAEAA